MHKPINLRYRDGGTNNSISESFLNLNILKTIFFGTLTNSVLWYLYAMFWAYVVLYLIFKIKGFRIAYWAAIPLLLLHIFARIYVTENYDIEEYVFIFRSFFLFAVPFILIGRFIAEYEKAILEKINNFRIFFIIFVGLCLMVAEYLIYQQFMDLHVSTIFISIGMFLSAVKNPQFKYLRFMAHIGKHVSKYVFILHIPVMRLGSAIVSVLNLNTEGNVLYPFAILMATIGISYAYVFILKPGITKIFRRNKAN